MKKLFITILAFAAAALSICEAKDNNKFLPEVRKSLDNLDLKIRINTVMPNAGPMINNSDIYTLTIKDGIADCYLPFYGESHTSVIYGVDETGIRLDNCPVKIKVDKSKMKKGKCTLEFTGRSGNDDWRFIIEVWNQGQVNISCNCSNKTGMHFVGELDFDE